MEKRELYIELRRKLDNINELVAEAQKFASENKLLMGQPRGNPAMWETLPDAKVNGDWPRREITDADYDDENDRDIAYDRWIGSEVCW
jgi:hypothetical protein